MHNEILKIYLHWISLSFELWFQFSHWKHSGESLRDNLLGNLEVRNNSHEFPEKFRFSQKWFLCRFRFIRILAPFSRHSHHPMGFLVMMNYIGEYQAILFPVSFTVRTCKTKDKIVAQSNWENQFVVLWRLLTDQPTHLCLWILQLSVCSGI